MPYILAALGTPQQQNRWVTAKPMTVGQLARRSGVSIRALREYEALGLIYVLGRSGSNYRLFDESALWCLQIIQRLRALGLTLKEIQEISSIYVRDRNEAVGPYRHEILNRALDRIDTRIAELQATRDKVHDFRDTHAIALAGAAHLDLYAGDPRRGRFRVAS
jgi:MerR family transcriptional regulator, copper efflux regulator